MGARTAKDVSRRRGSGARFALQAAPWLALAILIALWPTSPRSRQSRLEAELLKHEPGRGRSARSPRQIPHKGWSDVVWRTWKEFNDDRITTVAGGVTFFCILALFPGLAAFVSLYGLFADIHDAQQQILMLAGVAPRGAVVFIGEQMIRISEQKGSVLSLTFVVSLLLSLWSANSGTKALLNGLNIAYEEREKRSYIWFTLHSLVFTIGAVVLVLVYFGAVVALPLMLPFLHNGAPWLAVLRWPALLILTMLMLAVIYRYGPSRERARWRWVSWGSAAAAALWMGASFAYSWYVGHLAHYDRAYGPFGAAAGAIIWLWLTIVVILLGAELNAEIEHQTAVDSTTGEPEPLGQRGAVMADTIGKPTGPPRIPWISDLFGARGGPAPARLKTAPTVRP